MEIIINEPKGVTKKVPVAFFDLDGTVRFSRSGGFIKSPNDIMIYSRIKGILKDLVEKGFLIVGVTNQGGIAYGYRTPAQVIKEVEKTNALCGNLFHSTYVSTHHQDGSIYPYNNESLLRKPEYGMFALCEFNLLNGGYSIDWDESFFVGDSSDDMGVSEKCPIITFYEATYFREAYPNLI